MRNRILAPAMFIAYDDPDDGGSGGGGTPPTPDPKPDPPAPTNVLSAEQQKYLDGELAKARRSTEEGILKSLGITDKSQLKGVKEAVDAQAAAAEANKTELQKAADAQAAAERERDEAKAETDKLRFEMKQDAALIAAGLPAKNVERVRGMLKGIDATSEDAAVTAAAEELKTEFPDLFTEAGEEGDPAGGGGSTGRPPHSDPGRPPRKPSNSKDSKSRSRSLLHERHPELANKS